MTRVRACKPGSQARAWAQLLDQITEAKATLTDRALRERYDLQRKAPAVATAAPTNPNLLPPSHQVAPAANIPQPAAHPIDPMSPMAPMPMNPQTAAPWGSQPTPAAAVPHAVPYLQPATHGPAAPNPMAPVASAAPVATAMPYAMPNPMAPVTSAAPFAQSIPMARAPMAPMQPAAMPVAAPLPMQAAPIATPAFAAQAMGVPEPQPVDDAPKLKRKRTATARAQSNSGGALGAILLGGGVGGLIIIVVGVGFYLAGNQPEPKSPPIAAANAVPFPAEGGEATSTVSRRLDEIPESERPKPEVFTLPPQTTPAEVPAPMNMTPQPTPTVEPAPSPTPPPSTPEPMAATVLSSQDLRSLAQSLTTARTAIGEMNFSVVDQEIAKARALAIADEHKEKIRRLQLLNDYVTRFRAAIDATLEKVSAGDQIDLGDNRSFGIVEKTPELLIIRVNGQNQRYPMAELPAGLAARLAEMSLDKAAPETIAMKAAFVSVNPKIGDDNLEKIRSWWDEAASVRDVPDLLIALNDDYSLNKGKAAVPQDPNALAALGARADRLKDARTIEAFAKEYQSAIDESLKTLEPETELSVGGSTNVVVKELKSGRIMLSVADETRGFQIAKLPLGLASSIAERILPPDAALTLVMKGAYFATREKDQASKQFRPVVLDWWKQAGEMDPQLQATISELAKQYPE